MTIVGFTSPMSVTSVSMLSAYAIVAPAPNMEYCPAIRSKMCESGSTDTVESVDVIGIVGIAVAQFEKMLSCVSITPLGSPVVPEV